MFMIGFLGNVGFVAIILLIFFIIKKVDDYLYFKKVNSLGVEVMYFADDKVYKAARAFAQGVSSDEIREILLNCVDFDEEDISQIMTSAEPHKTDDDGGYGAFIKTVNKTLGEVVY